MYHAPTPDQVLARRQRIGDQIRAAREQQNLTQEGVALRMGMQRSNYVRIEQGQASPKLDTLIRVADAIGLPLAHLVRE